MHTLIPADSFLCFRVSLESQVYQGETESQEQMGNLDSLGKWYVLQCDIVWCFFYIKTVCLSSNKNGSKSHALLSHIAQG